MNRKIVILFCLAVFAGCVHQTTLQMNPLHLSWTYSLPGHAARVSSYDKTGKNSDNIQIIPGETVTLADIQGPGIIRRIWTTTNATGPIGRTLVLRIYWDGSNSPSVEAPYGDFFGVGHGMEADVTSWPITVVSRGRSRNSWWPMPFEKGARITITNDGDQPHGAFYFHIDYLALDSPPPTKERFHAQYRQAYPADFPQNYPVLETQGTGHFVGAIMSVESTKPNWWGEGDELIEADEHEPLYGTGTEEYFGDAWGMHPHSTLWHGSPVCEGYDKEGLRSSMYRFHILDPIPFKHKIKVSIEHGTQNDRADNISSVALWYQIPPASPFPPFPNVVDRVTGEERTVFVRERAWRLASSDAPQAIEDLKDLVSKTGTSKNKALVQGLLIYVEGKADPSDKVLQKLDALLKDLEEKMAKLSKDDLYIKPKIDAPTDNDNLIPGPLAASYLVLERARHDLARRVALERGLREGDEILVEARDPLGHITPPPFYEETPDFTNSYAKADDTRLTGNGARFTYGNQDPSWARFTPCFPRAGKYEVLVIFSYGANADDTRYEIRHADVMKTVPLPQRGRLGTEARNSAAWHSLGTFRFEKGQNADKGSVTLLTSPGTAIPNKKFEYRAYADSARFIFKGE